MNSAAETPTGQATQAQTGAHETGDAGAILEIEDVQKSFGGIHAVQGAGFSVRKGSIPASSSASTSRE